MKLNKCWIEKRTDVRSSFASFILGAFAFVYVRLYDGGDVVQPVWPQTATRKYYL